MASDITQIVKAAIYKNEGGAYYLDAPPLSPSGQVIGKSGYTFGLTQADMGSSGNAQIFQQILNATTDDSGLSQSDINLIMNGYSGPGNQLLIPRAVYLIGDEPIFAYVPYTNSSAIVNIPGIQEVYPGSKQKIFGPSPDCGSVYRPNRRCIAFTSRIPGAAGP